MKPRSDPADPTDPVAQAAAEWTLRHDRGLTAAEQDEFSQWLAADPRHCAAWAEHRWGWDELDRLAGLQISVHAVPNPDLLAPKKGRLLRFSLSRSRALSLLAAAAAVALGFVLWERPWSQPPALETLLVSPRSLALIERRELSDGSMVELNRGAVVTERFTPTERRVRLERGEAQFKVAKDAERPFVVEAAGVVVRAVGTVFNVRIEPATVEVLVTEGKVQVNLEDRKRTTESGAGIAVPDDPQSSIFSPLSSGTILEAGRHAVVSLASDAPEPQVVTISHAEIEARLAWQPRLLDFTDESLAAIVTEFNRHNPVRLTLGDPSLAAFRLSATFRSDNVEGFVRLMMSDFGMRAEGRDGNEIALYKVSAPQKF